MLVLLLADYANLYFFALDRIVTSIEDKKVFVEVGCLCEMWSHLLFVWIRRSDVFKDEKEFVGGEAGMSTGSLSCV